MKRNDQGGGGHRDERAASVLVELAAEYIAREAGRKTLITPMRADISPDRKNATIFVSVFPDSDTHHALEFLARQKEEFYLYMKKEARFPIIPNVKFEFDWGEQNRQRLDELTKEAGGPNGLGHG